MSIARTPMTVNGSKKLESELFNLKTVERPRVIEDIAVAREHGDLKENAEYHAAREEQSFIEGRISEIESKLSSAQIVDLSKVKNEGKVVFAAKVSLLNIDTDVSVNYQIVGDDEAEIKSGKISFGSPIAKSIIGKYVGDEVEVQTPGGKLSYEIESVDY